MSKIAYDVSIDDIKDIVQRHYPQYTLVKRRIKPPPEGLGKAQFTEDNYLIARNPISGYEYGYEHGSDLRTRARENKWCGQYAGKTQWASIGRRVVDDRPYVYHSMHRKEIILYAYEQTESFL